MRAATLAFLLSLSTALPLAAQDAPTNPLLTDEPIASHVYLGTQAHLALLSDERPPRLHKVWYALTGILRKGDDVTSADIRSNSANVPDTIGRSHLLQW